MTNDASYQLMVATERPDRLTIRWTFADTGTEQVMWIGTPEGAEKFADDIKEAVRQWRALLSEQATEGAR